LNRRKQRQQSQQICGFAQTLPLNFAQFYLRFLSYLLLDAIRECVAAGALSPLRGFPVYDAFFRRLSPPATFCRRYAAEGVHPSYVH
jgi:hypothetical protein